MCSQRPVGILQRKLSAPKGSSVYGVDLGCIYVSENPIKDAASRLIQSSAENLVRDTVGTGVYFGGYETTKFLLTSEERPAGPMTQFLAGGICGILCWLAVFPIDLVKSLLQKDVLAPCPRYPDAATCIHDIYKTRGFTGFYRGVTVTLMRAFP